MKAHLLSVRIAPAAWPLRGAHVEAGRISSRLGSVNYTLAKAISYRL
jgi:hypothetical protein